MSEHEPTRREQLVQHVRNKDAEALADFIEETRHQLNAFIEKQLSDQLRRKITADDIFQDVSVNAVSSLDDIDLSDRDPFAWLCQLAERRIIDAHRRYFGAKKRDAKREVALSAGGSNDNSDGLIGLLVSSITSPSKVFSRQIREQKLLAALDELGEDQKNALIMRYVDNLPSKQIAAKLEKTDAAVRVMLTRSLKKLGEILGEEPHA